MIMYAYKLSAISSLDMWWLYRELVIGLGKGVWSIEGTYGLAGAKVLPVSSPTWLWMGFLMGI